MKLVFNKSSNKSANGLLSRFNNASIGFRLGLMTAIVSALLLAGGLFAFSAINESEAELDRLYLKRMIPIEQATALQRDAILNRLLLLEATVRATDEETTKSYLQQIDANILSITMNWQLVSANAQSKKERELVEAYTAARNNFGQSTILPIRDALQSGDRDSALLMEEFADQNYQPVSKTVSAIVDHYLKQATLDIQAAIDRNNRFRIVVLVSVLGALLITIVSSILINRSITRPLKKAVVLAESVSAGDLTVHVESNSNDEVGQLLRSISRMSAKLREVVARVSQSVLNVEHSARQISEGNTALSERTEEQASSLEETASSMEEMTTTVNQNADFARRASELANIVRTDASKGSEVVERAINAMGEINKSSGRISEIVTTIDGIAFQTNLLALNAAVEAARAGQEGRGFAVVASEVRALAQRSAEAAKEIKALILDSASKVQAGTNLVDESGKTLMGIVEGINTVANIVADIKDASQEQSLGINQVNTAVTRMDDMTQQNAAMLEETVASTRAMHQESEGLAELMRYFKLDEMDKGSGNSASLPSDHRTNRLARTKPSTSFGETPPKLQAAVDDPDWERF